LVLPNGITYRMLVLPKLQTMRPELLLKIQQLVNEGAVVFGPSPATSPSLQNFKKADEQVRKITAALWGSIDGKAIATNHYGKGLVINGIGLQEALTMINAQPDCKINGDDSVLFIHRKISNDDIYFISNQKSKSINFDGVFKVTGKKPELWDAVTGGNRLLPAYTISTNTTTIPLMLAANGSAFIVFRAKDLGGKKVIAATNFPAQNVIAAVTTPWQVKFDTGRWGPEKPVTFNQLIDWTKSDNDQIKYYSGSAVYHNTFTVDKVEKKQRVFLDLGKLTAMATITINGAAAGGVWTAPYQLEITDFIKQGINTMDIAVVNTWVNRLIKDATLPEKERKTWVSINPYTVESPLDPAGLLGPVLIRRGNK